jgi:hypothetical protein
VPVKERNNIDKFKTFNELKTFLDNLAKYADLKPFYEMNSKNMLAIYQKELAAGMDISIIRTVVDEFNDLVKNHKDVLQRMYLPKMPFYLRQDIVNYTRFQDLEAVVDNARAIMDRGERKNDGEERDVEFKDAEIIYDDDKLAIYRGLSPNACVEIRGKHPTSWCVTRSDTMYWHYRNNAVTKPTFYFVKNKEKLAAEGDNPVHGKYKDKFHFFVLMVDKPFENEFKQHVQRYKVVSANNGDDSYMNWDDIVKIEPLINDKKQIFQWMDHTENEKFTFKLSNITPEEFIKLTYEEKNKALAVTKEMTYKMWESLDEKQKHAFLQTNKQLPYSAIIDVRKSGKLYSLYLRNLKRNSEEKYRYEVLTNSESKSFHNFFQGPDGVDFLKKEASNESKYDILKTRIIYKNYLQKHGMPPLNSQDIKSAVKELDSLDHTHPNQNAASKLLTAMADDPEIVQIIKQDASLLKRLQITLVKKLSGPEWDSEKLEKCATAFGIDFTPEQRLFHILNTNDDKLKVSFEHNKMFLSKVTPEIVEDAFFSKKERSMFFGIVESVNESLIFGWFKSFCYDLLRNDFNIFNDTFSPARGSKNDIQKILLPYFEKKAYEKFGYHFSWGNELQVKELISSVGSIIGALPELLLNYCPLIENSRLGYNLRDLVRVCTTMEFHLSRQAQGLMIDQGKKRKERWAQYVTKEHLRSFKVFLEYLENIR